MIPALCTLMMGTMLPEPEPSRYRLVMELVEWVQPAGLNELEHSLPEHPTVVASKSVLLTDAMFGRPTQVTLGPLTTVITVMPVADKDRFEVHLLGRCQLPARDGAAPIVWQACNRWHVLAVDQAVCRPLEGLSTRLGYAVRLHRLK